MKTHTMNLKLFFLILVGFALSSQSQDISSIKNKFDIIYKNSSNYQSFKIVSKEEYLNLKTFVLDTMASYEKQLLEMKKKFIAKNTSFDALQLKLTKKEEALEAAIIEKNGFVFLGIHLNKSIYNLMIWGLIFLLLCGLFYFIYKFKNADVVTQKANYNLQEVESEFEKFRKKTIQNEQKLRRLLQDEINKQK